MCGFGLMGPDFAGRLEERMASQEWGSALQGPKKGQLPKPTEMDMRFMEHVMASRVQSRFRMRKWHRLIKAAKSKR